MAAVSRRAVLAAAAGLGATACGNPAAPPPAAAPPPPAPPASPPTAPDTGCARAVARTADIPVGGGRVFPDARVVVTQPRAGEFRGFGIVCTHDGCELDSVSDGTINCPCHGSRFAITDGSVVRGPARSGLRKERIVVDGGCVVVRGGAIG
jgi:Rieske Fe-S protein